MEPPRPGPRNIRRGYSLQNTAKQALGRLIPQVWDQVCPEIQPHLQSVVFGNNPESNGPYFPCPFKEAEAGAALKAIEASTVAAIADVRYGRRQRRVKVNLERAAAFMFSTYIATIGGLDKGDPEVKKKLKDTDINQAQSVLYRRFAANLFRTKNPDEYFHIHGSLDASTTLTMLGLEPYREDLVDYDECIRVIEGAVQKFTVEELEAMNAEARQAGVMAMTWDDFRDTEHGDHLLNVPPWTIKPLETSSPPAPFTIPPATSPTEKPRILTGIRVLELCRIIAGPSIGRSLAEYGATVLKVTSPHLPDVPYFQVDGNTGKHACDLDLRNPADRATFDALLETADVILDGYRPDALERLGYGPQGILEKIRDRGKGIVYISENCFGPSGPWATRPGWQQIADCATGVAWAQGKFMGLDEPVVPPFPMSDYGTGCMGTIAALTGLLKRATRGGSWYGQVSLCQYDVFLLSLGLYDSRTQAELRQRHDAAFFDLRHADNVDEVSKRALRSMQRLHPELFAERNTQTAVSQGFGGEEVRWARGAVNVTGVKVGFQRASRPNGFDEPTWEGWEVEEGVVEG